MVNIFHWIKRNNFKNSFFKYKQILFIFKNGENNG